MSNELFNHLFGEGSTIGENARSYLCVDCGQPFVWHPAASGMDRADECPACDSPFIIEIPYQRSEESGK